MRIYPNLQGNSLISEQKHRIITQSNDARPKVNSPVDLVFPPAQENEDNMATDYVARLKKSIQISH